MATPRTTFPRVAGRAAAVGEIVRVLKPGGRVAILDFHNTRQYAAALAAPGSVTSSARSAALAWTTKVGSSWRE
jgi:ubiquinone/menaquinone biosynthesis C-methylase UbiE